MSRETLWRRGGALVNLENAGWDGKSHVARIPAVRGASAEFQRVEKGM
jgi:hypothetical protein